MSTLPTPKLRPATADDARSLAPHLRPQDVAELEASSGDSPSSALLRGVEISEWAQAVEFGGAVAALFGVAPLLGTDADEPVGVPWLLCSDVFFEAAGSIRFHRHAFKFLRQMHQTFPHLVNLVDARNTVAIQWLSRLGFEFTGLHPYYGPGRIPFLQFERYRPCAAS